MQSMLSLDFDFFIPEKIEYDWGHRESSLFLDTVWAIRAGTALALGKDLTKTVIPVKDDDVEPLFFPAFLRGVKKAKFSKNSNYIFAESHATAYYAAEGMNEISLVHIDAHHDCGYHPEMKDLDCGNWIEHLQAEKRLKKLHIIYPQWRKDEENGSDFSDETEKKLDLWRKNGTEVQVTYGLKSFPVNQSFDTFFMCRSGAWTPPWCDKTFKQIATLMMTVFKRHSYQLAHFKTLEDMERTFTTEHVEMFRKSHIEAMDAFQKVRT